MNCERFQENLYDYLDDALASGEKSAAQLHLQTCRACRQAVENQRMAAQIISSRFKEAVETVEMDAITKRRMATAVREKIENTSEPEKRFPFPLWLRLAIPAAALVLICIWLSHVGFTQKNSFVSPGTGNFEVPVHVSYSAPRYIFRQEGAMVVDALISDTRVADGALLAKK
jgi:anti-sigma factor RsiW